MTTWHQRLLPYPLLAPWTEDYEDSSFGVDVPEAVLNNGREVKVGLVFRLYSETLRRMIEGNTAQYVVEVSCPRTFVRNTHQMLEQGQLLLDAGEYDSEILLTPYVLCVAAIDSFGSPEHAKEWRAHRPEGFKIPAAGILAVGNTTRVILEDSGINSVIDLISNPNVSEGTFNVILDEDRIKIHVPVSEKEQIEAVRSRRGSSVEFAALFPGIYLHAVVEALKSLSDHEHARWALTIRNSLERLGRGNVDDEMLRNDALRYGQDLMERPVGAFLTAAMNMDEEG